MSSNQTGDSGPRRVAPSAWKSSEARAVAVFVGAAVLMHLVLSTPAVQENVLDPYTRLVASASRQILRTFDQGIDGEGDIISGAGFSIRVANVCNGTDLFVLFTAAVLAFPASWRRRGMGLLVGIPLLAVLNLSRVMGLYLTGRFWPNVFEVSHLYLWQILLILVTLLVFTFYLRWSHTVANR